MRDMKDIKKVATYWAKKLRDAQGLEPGEELFFQQLLRAAKKSTRVLEVGVGRGRMLKMLSANGVAARCYGIDLTDSLMHTDPSVGKTKGDARELPYRNASFNLVYSLGVIEHFPETKLAIAEHARVTSKGGLVIVTTPHLSVFTPLRYLVYLVKESNRGTFEEIRGRNIRLKTIKEYFAAADLELVDSGLFGLYGVGRTLQKSRLDILRRTLQTNLFVGAYLYVIGKKKV